jgi:peptidoglycan/xylan/chitin deacetylase (PgdA/CDA1 family)
MLTVVMYHYVRRIAESRYPAIKGLEREAFIRQLEHIKAAYTPVSGKDVIDAIRGKPLPDDAVLLTFDDGYLDHYTVAFPLLMRERIPAVFFPPAKSVLHGDVLAVNKIHYILASIMKTSEIAAHIDAAVPDPREWRAKYAVENRFDPAEVIYIKRMLQVGLPQPLRGQLTDRLFAQYVTTDERAFGRELYMDEDQLRCMLAAGMMVGSHGYNHDWLDSLSPPDQAADVDRSIAFLRYLGVDDWTMCYPYGAWNESLLGILKARGCAAGFTTRVGVADLSKDDPLLLPRIDTNDLRSAQP